MKVSISVIREKLLDNFWKFVKFIDLRNRETGGKESLIPHIPLYRKVCDYLQDPNKHTMLVLPRKFRKTTLATLLIVWRLLRFAYNIEPDNTIVVFTETGDNAKDMLEAVHEYFTDNDKLKALFNSHTLIKRKTQSLIKLRTSVHKKDPNLRALSILSKRTGIRCKYPIFDDIWGDDATNSRAERDKTIRKFRIIIPYYEKSTKILYIGTHWCEGDLISLYEESQKKKPKSERKWEIIKESVLDENGHAKFPEVMDIDEINDRRYDEGMTEAFFSAQYLNNPVNNETNIFNLDEYQRYKDIPSIDYVCMAVDFSDGVGKDLNAFVVVGKGDDGKFYLLDAFGHNRISSIKLYYTLRQYYYRYSEKCLNVIVELNRNGRTILNDTFNRLKEENGDDIPFTGIQNTEKKNIRIEKLQSLLSAGKLILPDSSIVRDNSGLSSLLSELRDFNYTTNANQDDLIDALSMCVVAMQRRENLNKKHQAKSSRYFGAF